ncbi:uncharacterized protein SCHCODRAFT_02608582 [Schizophyllum commune H4-8]|nr:uncharacterized protein SCHCODRAFT_02608582 [Schizophyllum commune H4-8]KAI5900685.1 hypothetical protein SCHCODRAFT_02608582 [Schizophyllum commune H4-8]
MGDPAAVWLIHQPTQRRPRTHQRSALWDIEVRTLQPKDASSHLAILGHPIITPSPAVIMYSPTSSIGSLKRTSTRYRPATPKQDIERILDSGYASDSVVAKARRYDGVYVDSTGELHDPSFREFPSLTHLYDLEHNRAHHMLRNPGRVRIASEEEDEMFLSNERPCGCKHPYPCSRPCDCPRSVCPYAARRSPAPSAAPQPPITFAAPVTKTERKSSISSVFSRKSERSSHSSSSHSHPTSEPIADATVAEESEGGDTTLVTDKDTASDSEHSSDHTLCSDDASSPGSSKLRRFRSGSASAVLTKAAQDKARPSMSDHMREQWVAASLPVRLGLFRAERKIQKRLASLSQRTAGGRPTDAFIAGRRSLDAAF